MIEEYTKDHYQLLAEWWKGHGWDAVPAQVLPKLGVLGTVNDKPCAAGFVYMDNSVGVAMMEWVVTDPSANPLNVYKALKEVQEYLCRRVKELGYGVILTSCKQESLAKFYQKQEFHKTDEGLTHFIKTL